MRRTSSQPLSLPDTPDPLVVRLGPYALKLAFLPRERMPHRGRHALVSIERGLFAVRSDLSRRDMALAFLRALIRLVHYSRGCQPGCIEEAYTHSFATGLVEFAQRNPAVWFWFNELIGGLGPRPRDYGRVVVGAVPRAPAPPRRVLVGDFAVELKRIGSREAGRAFGWYLYEERQAQLVDDLHGVNLAIVAVHELTHAVHAHAGLDDGGSHTAFVQAQARHWLDFALRNPAAWRWLVWLMAHDAREAARLPVAA